MDIFSGLWVDFCRQESQDGAEKSSVTFASSYKAFSKPQTLRVLTQTKTIIMFKYLVVLALALACVMAAPPAPGAPIPAAGVPKDLQTANQLLYGYGVAGVPLTYSSGYYGSPYYGSAVYYG
ncbi:unnamed protein product [Allacma fusca]|uniref:Uncharacterized protein n=1 Tax=Allacma fusca TaxID=39272 RepID=A0A8J2KE42_9HEXA|nr:unnamed protein product [Allacma fusca]